MRRARIAAFYLAAAGFAAAACVAPPIDRLADRSFAWHMTQHLAIFYLVSLLVLRSRPFDLFAELTGKRTTAAFVRVTRNAHWIAQPPAAFAFAVGVLWLSHFSPLYERSLEWPLVHAVEHLLYLVAGIAFWLPVLAPPPLRPFSYPVRLLYLALWLPQGALLGMVLGSARAPLYPHYAALAGSVSSALADQRDAAAVMWIAGGLIVFSAFLLTLAAWAHREREPVSC